MSDSCIYINIFSSLMLMKTFQKNNEIYIIILYGSPFKINIYILKKGLNTFFYLCKFYPWELGNALNFNDNYVAKVVNAYI